MNIVPVTSFDDPRLADYRAVKDRQWLPEFQPGAQPDPAAPHGKFMAEGEVVLHHLVRSTFPTLSVLLTPARLATCQGDLALLPPSTPIYLIEQRLMNDVIGFHLHRGLLAIAARHPPTTLPAFLDQAARRSGPLVILEHLTNHDNIGSIFRSASCFGAAGVILSPQCADPLYRKAVRVAVGHTLRIPFTTAPQWPAALDDIRSAGWKLAILTPGPDAVNIRAWGAGESTPGRIALLLGTEGPGVSPEAAHRADLRLCIGMVDGVDSLNVAVTAGIALHHLCGL